MSGPARTALAASAATAALALGLGFANDVPGADKVPVPRVCWFSDYANAKLSNRCTFDKAAGRWMLAVDGRLVDARTQRLEIANLCLYFHGERCP